MEITRIRLENYKGIKSLDAKTYHKTQISGKNAVGKTTVADAIFDIMCDKMSDGTAPNNIRPHENNGEVIHNVPVVREIVADIDGTTYTICKKTEEKWRKPHGSSDMVYDGTKTTYSIDGFEKQLKDYTAWLETHIANQVMISFYMNPQVFLNALRKSTTEARKLLEKVSGFSVNEFIQGNPEFAEISKLVGENLIEDVLKQLRRNLKNQKDALETARKNLEYEKSREVPLADADATQKEILEAKLEELKAKKQESEIAKLEKVAERDSLKKEIDEMIADKARMEKEAFVGNSTRVHELEMEVMKLMADINTSKAKISDCEEYIKMHESKIVELTEQSKRYQIESTKDTCPTCGQKVPAEKMQSKVKTYGDAIAKNMLSVEQRRKEIEEKKAELSMLNSALELANNNYEQARSSLEKAKSEKSEFVYADKEKLYSLNSKLSMMNEDLLNEDKSIDLEITQVSAKLAGVKALYEMNKNSQSQKDKLLEGLNAKVKEESMLCSDIERKIDMVTDFSIKKNEALAEKINPYFNHFYFKFIEYTELEHNPVETCRIIEKETNTDYMNGLNHGSKIVCEAEMVAGFQKMNNVSLPIILDDSESVDTDKVPKVEQQLFVLRRVDDKPLTVEELS